MKKTMKKLNLILASVVLSTMFLFTSCEDEYSKITFNDLPLLAREFLNTHFPNETISYIMEDNEILDHSYEVNFTSGNNVDFKGDGEWYNVDCHSGSVPNSVLGEQICNYIQNNHPESYAVEIDRNTFSYDVELNNGLELVFDLSFNFERYED